MLRRRHTLTLLALFCLAALVPSSDAGADAALKGKTYHFGTSEARTNVTFVSEADLETIHGVTHKMQGSIKIDATGAKASGMLRVGVRTLETGITLRDEHLRSPTWMDAGKFPWVRLDLTSITEDKGGKTWTWKGKLTVKGVAKELTGSARVTVIPDALGEQLGEGSWIRVRTKFDVKLSDHGIKVPEHVGAKVNDVWKINIGVYGTTAAPR